MINIILEVVMQVPRSQNSETWKSPKLESLDQVFSLSLRGGAAAEEAKTEDLDLDSRAEGISKSTNSGSMGLSLLRAKIRFLLLFFIKNPSAV